MQDTELCRRLRGLEPPWKAARVELDVKQRRVYESVLNQAGLSFVAAMDAITESGDATDGDACVQALEKHTQRSSKDLDHMLATFFPPPGGSPPPDPNTDPPSDPATPPQVDPTTPVA